MADTIAVQPAHGIPPPRCISVVAPSVDGETDAAPTSRSPSSTLPSFDAVYQQHERAIYNTIFRMVGNPDDAADLTAQTFLHAFRAYDRFRGQPSVFTWLYRIALNVCKNHYRRRDKEQARLRPVSLECVREEGDEACAREIEDWRFAPDAHVDRQAVQDAVQRAIMALSPDYRTVIVLRDIQGLSYQEIAEATGCSLEAIKSRIFRARGVLRALLGPLLDVPGAG